MPKLSLTEDQQSVLKNEIKREGVLVTGGSDQGRKSAALRHMTEPVISIDCRDIESFEDLIEQGLIEMGMVEARAEVERNLGHFRTRINNESYSLLIAEVDALSEPEQKSIFRILSDDVGDFPTNSELVYTSSFRDAIKRVDLERGRYISTYSTED